MPKKTLSRHRMMFNIALFIFIALGGGFLGLLLDSLNPPATPMEGPGSLLWILSPALALVIVRSFAGDGWKDFGLRPGFRQNGHWYLSALLIPIVTTAVTLGLGLWFGAATLAGFTDQRWGGFLALAATAFAISAVKNLFEEFAWRGYLTPRFEALGLHPYANSLLTGFVWAAWHIPYYLFYLDRTVFQAHTSMEPGSFILLTFLVMPLHALVYGELRLLSRSVWTSWLLHTVGNALSLTLITHGFVTMTRDPAGLILSPGMEGAVTAVLMGLIGLGLYARRKKTAGPELLKGGLS